MWECTDRRPEVARRARAEVLIRLVAEVGLRGRGGAGYPLATKLGLVAGRRGRATVVVNGAKSEPGARKGASLLAGAPPSPVEDAIEERAAAGDEPVFIGGERGPALPTLSPPHAAERGVHGHPTLVSNVEALAQLAPPARHSASWFRSVGTADEPGTLLVTITSAGAAQHGGRGALRCAARSPSADRAPRCGTRGAAGRRWANGLAQFAGRGWGPLPPSPGPKVPTSTEYRSGESAGTTAD